MNYDKIHALFTTELSRLQEEYVTAEDKHLKLYWQGKIEEMKYTLSTLEVFGNE